MIGESPLACTMVVFLVLLAACAPQRTATGSVNAVANAADEGSAGSGVMLPDGSRIRVELAVDDPTRAQGLMYRESLAADRGMLFLFPENGRYPFWMKNTFIPLDMIWIDQSGKIVAIRQNVPPCRHDPCPSYDPNAEARSVLELAAGEAARHHLALGETVAFQNIDRFPVR